MKLSRSAGSELPGLFITVPLFNRFDYRVVLFSVPSYRRSRRHQRPLWASPKPNLCWQIGAHLSTDRPMAGVKIYVYIYKENLRGKEELLNISNRPRCRQEADEVDWPVAFLFRVSCRQLLSSFRFFFSAPFFLNGEKKKERGRWGTRRNGRGRR